MFRATRGRIQIDVPPADVTSRGILPTSSAMWGWRYVAIVICPGALAAGKALNAFKFGDASFWIADDTFDGKLAFTCFQVLLGLTRATAAARTVLVIPVLGL